MSNIESTQTASVYVSTELRDKQRIEVLRDNMLWNIDADTFYKRVTPHITIVPPFLIPADNIDDFKEVIDNTELEDHHVEVNGAAVWRNIHKPYVVMLDVDAQIEQMCYELVSEAKQLGGYNFKEPVSPHITLFKSKGWWETVPDTVAWKLQTEIKRNRVLPDTEIDELKLMVS